MSLSACLIVRDEERFLDRCLSSLRGQVDEICIVDTGSRDRTLEIARAHGAKIATRAWDDDFSAARNASLALATGEWILQVDADEELVAPAPGAWSVLADRSAFCYLVELELRGDAGRSKRVWQPRLFRNDPRLRYNRPLHENVLDGLHAAGLPSPVQAPLLLVHHGYTGEIVASRDKLARNARILRSWRARGKADAYDLYKLAVVLESLDDAEVADERPQVWAECLALGTAAVPGLRREWPWWPRAFSGAAEDLRLAGRIATALATLEEASRDFPADATLATALAATELRSGRPIPALQRLALDSIPPRLLGLCREMSRDLDGAWQAWSGAPEHVPLQARLLARVGRFDEAITLLSRTIESLGTGADPTMVGDAAWAAIALGEGGTATALLSRPCLAPRAERLRWQGLRAMASATPLGRPPIDVWEAAHAIHLAATESRTPALLDRGFEPEIVRERIADILDRQLARGEEAAVRRFAVGAPAWEGCIPGIARLVEGI